VRASPVSLWRILAYNRYSKHFKLCRLTTTASRSLSTPSTTGLRRSTTSLWFRALARLCQHTGVTPSSFYHALPQDKADNSNMEHNSWPHVRSNDLQTNFRRLQLILLSANLFFTILITFLRYTYRFPLAGVRSTLVFNKTFFSIRPTSSTHIFSPSALSPPATSHQG
jgi:hypothetical protein